MKVAIASSGLGHIHRGMEAWAEDIAQALFGRGVDVTLFGGAGPVRHEYDVVLNTLKRNEWPAKVIAKLTSKGGWRIGLGAPHAVESFIFGLRLLKCLRHNYDLIHVQQGSLGIFLMGCKKLGLLQIPVVLANGQIASEEFLSNFEYVQDLSPFTRNGNEDNYGNNTNNAKRYTIPNFVDNDIYFPQDKKESRRKLKLPESSFIVATVGAINKHHKRMHYFIEEMARLEHETDTPLHALIVGAKDLDTAEIINLARKKLGGRVTILLNLSRNIMPEIYNASDVFALCSLREAFGIVLIEAMACGLPVICNKHPVLEWVVQEGGECIDMTKRGNLASLLKIYSEDKKHWGKRSQNGRKRVLREFSKEAVVSKTIEMYESITSRSSNERFS